jgi:hypothetical protein
MGKAGRNKHLKRQQAANLEQYGGVKLSAALIDRLARNRAERVVR